MSETCLLRCRIDYQKKKNESKILDEITPSRSILRMNNRSREIGGGWAVGMGRNGEKENGGKNKILKCCCLR